MKHSLFDVVTLVKDIPEHSLKAGMIGAVIDIYTVPSEAYEIEFCDKDGRTIAILTLLPDQILKAHKSSI